jgi:hypothetical protein
MLMPHVVIDSAVKEARMGFMPERWRGGLLKLLSRYDLELRSYVQRSLTAPSGELPIGWLSPTPPMPPLAQANAADPAKHSAPQPPSPSIGPDMISGTQGQRDGVRRGGPAGIWLRRSAGRLRACGRRGAGAA